MVETSPADRPAMVSMEAGLRPWRSEVVMSSERGRSEDAVTTVGGRSKIENHVRVGARSVKVSRIFQQDSDAFFHRL